MPSLVIRTLAVLATMPLYVLDWGFLGTQRLQSQPRKGNTPNATNRARESEGTPLRLCPYSALRGTDLRRARIGFPHRDGSNSSGSLASTRPARIHASKSSR